jgi:hypothetical protein
MMMSLALILLPDGLVDMGGDRVLPPLIEPPPLELRDMLPIGNRRGGADGP